MQDREVAALIFARRNDRRAGSDSLFRRGARRPGTAPLIRGILRGSSAGEHDRQGAGQHYCRRQAPHGFARNIRAKPADFSHSFIGCAVTLLLVYWPIKRRTTIYESQRGHARNRRQSKSGPFAVEEAPTGECSCAVLHLTLRSALPVRPHQPPVAGHKRSWQWRSITTRGTARRIARARV